MIERISPIDHPNKDLEIARRVQVLLATIGARLPRIKYLDFMSTFKQRLSSKHALSDGMIESTIETVCDLFLILCRFLSFSLSLSLSLFFFFFVYQHTHTHTTTTISGH
jgi:hypothetical protein